MESEDNKDIEEFSAYNLDQDERGDDEQQAEFERIDIDGPIEVVRTWNMFREKVKRLQKSDWTILTCSLVPRSPGSQSSQK